MELEEIKKQMKDWKDLFGSHLLDKEDIESAQTKEELALIIERHHEHLSDRANDAQSHLERFQRSVELYNL